VGILTFRLWLVTVAGPPVPVLQRRELTQPIFHPRPPTSSLPPLQPKDGPSPNHPRTVPALEEFDIEIVEQVPVLLDKTKIHSEWRHCETDFQLPPAFFQAEIPDAPSANRPSVAGSKMTTSGPLVLPAIIGLLGIVS
jgi:hypothetical protein